MNPLVVVAAFTLLVLLLVLLSNWQRKVDAIRKQEVIAEIREAEAGGTSKALAQHPQIDVEACIGCGSCIAVCPEDDVLGLVDGVARVIHGARCVGHGFCADACPVAAVKIGLGDVALRTDIPVLSEDLETSEPGVYIAGELGGFGLIRIAVEQGTRAIAAIAKELEREGAAASDDRSADVLVVGSGPAGLAATLEAARLDLSYVTIDQDDLGGTVRKYPRRKLTLTGPLVLPLHGPVRRREYLKEELIEFWESLVERFELDIHSGVKLLAITREGSALRAETNAGIVRARKVVLALGRRGTPRRLGVPGEDKEKVLYQLVDAASINGQRILVVGGGDSAVEAATALASQKGNTVTLSYRRPAFFRLKRRNQERVERFAKEGRIRVLFESQVEHIHAKDSVSLVQSQGGESRSIELPNDFVFVLAGGDPPYPLLRQIGVRFTGDGEAAAVGAPARAGVPS